MTRTGYSAPGTAMPSADYSPAARVGNIVWTAGQAGKDPATGELVSDDIAGQTRQTLINIATALEGAGVGLDQVVRVGIFLANLDDRAEMNKVYEGFFGSPPPARTTVGATLPPGMLIEVDVMAVVD